MALGATLYVFDIRLADADRNVYETLSLRIARHPSESEEHLLTRVLAYCLEYTEGIAFSSGGLSNPDEPTLAAPRVAVYAHKYIDLLLTKLRGERVHRADTVEVHAMDRALLATLTTKLQRRMTFDVSIADRTLYLTLGDETLAASVTQHSIVS